MIKSDCHLHTSFSSDSDADMSDMVSEAVKCGLETICFTEHMDLQFPTKYDLEFIFDPDEYINHINTIKNTFKGKINILTGIEIGMKPNLTCEYEPLLSSYGWDYVIGSTHLINDIDPYYDEYWEGMDEKAAVNKYYECVYKNICGYNNYDSLGHLDYILRYAPSGNQKFSYRTFADIIDCILKHIIDCGKALEINTSGYKAGLEAPNPSADIIKRYMELGGELFTIGSDAHCPKHIAYGYNSVYVLLASLGVKYYMIYENRKPRAFLLK